MPVLGPVDFQIPVMPLDQALYDPIRTVIWGVRGGRIYQFDATTGNFTGIFLDFDPRGMSPSCLCYSSALDRIFVSCWLSPNFPEISGQATSVRTLYRINPATPAVDNSYDFGTIVGETTGQIQFGIVDMAMVTAGSYIYAAYVTTRRGPQISAVKMLASNPLSSPNYNYDFDLDGYLQTVSMETDSGKEYMWTVDYSNSSLVAFDVGHVLPNTPVYVTDNAKQLWACAFDTQHNTVYATSFSRYIYKYDNTGALLATLDTGRANFFGIRIRFNPNDNKIYAAGFGDMTVVVVDPNSSDSITVKTGFDLPGDLVFTPTLAFAVQQGIAGLKKIV